MPVNAALSRRKLIRQLLILPSLAMMSCAGARPRKLTDAGAAGDGVTDDTLAITKALCSGQRLDGENRRFAVYGNIIVAKGFVGLSNATFVQKAPATVDRRTLTIRTSKDFTITNLVIEQGRESIASSTKLMMERGALFIQNCSNFRLDHVTVRGGGCGTGLALQFCNAFEASDILVEGLTETVMAMPDDDILQGFLIQQSQDFHIIRPRVRSLRLKIGDTFIADQSRGLVIGGSSRFEVTDLDVRTVAQGLDVTGSDGNSSFLIRRGHARDCGTWGFKFANTAREGMVTDAVAERCGLAGFVASGPAEKVATPSTQSLRFQRCRVEGIVGNWRRAGTFGFGIMDNPATAPGYPRAIRFEHCVADGGEGGKMLTGFRNDLPDLTGPDRNLASHCSASRYTEQPFRGFSAI